MSRGNVYILTNSSMPGLVKIGKTTRGVEARANELYQTGVPTPFEVAHSVATPDCDGLEASVHNRLRGVRVSDAREFFKISTEEALKALESELYEQVSSIISEFMPEYTLAKEDLHIDEGDMSALAVRLDEPVPVIAHAFYLMTPEEYLPVVRRYYDRRSNKNTGVSGEHFPNG